jgi:hypothetical protein
MSNENSADASAYELRSGEFHPPGGRQAGRPHGGAADEVLTGLQPQDGECPGRTIPNTMLIREDEVNQWAFRPGELA